MWSFFLIVLAVSSVIAAGAFVFLKGINWKEFGCIFLVNLVIAGSSAGIVSCSSKHDTEIWNGRVTNKYSHHVSCEHDYPCNPYPCNCDSKGRCSTCWHTCYDHAYDVNWTVNDSVGQSWNISRIDRQGLSEPPRYTAVVIGEPTSGENSYDNYIKASPGSLFRHQGLMEKYATTLPNEPMNIYDYYRLDRLVLVGASVDDPRAWNWDLMNINADLGHKKQANIKLVIVKNQPQDWYYALEEKWIGGKKNDVTLVVGVDNDMKPQWATVMAWTTNELFKVKLRDDVMNDSTLTRDAVMADLRTNVDQYFQRKPMADFQYLEAEMTPSTTAWVITLIIALLVSIGLTVFFELNDPFEEGDTDDDFVTNFKRSRRRRGYGY